MATHYSAPDLTLHPPRNPRIRLGGYVFLPRLIDKARAEARGALGEYRWANPMDLVLLKYLGVTPEALHAAVLASETDAAVLAWVHAQTGPRPAWEITAWSTWFETLAPFSNERRERLSLRVSQAHAETRTDLTTWFSYLELDDFFTFGGKPTDVAQPPAVAAGGVQWMAPNLEAHPPRSVRTLLGGYAILARVIDKGRAKAFGKAGEFKYGCGSDQHWLTFAGIDAEALYDQIASGASDGALLAWIESQTSLAPWQIAAWTAHRSLAVPASNEDRAFLSAQVEAMPGGPAREDLATWFDFLDADDFATFGGKL
jgi:hypothetical protein